MSDRVNDYFFALELEIRSVWKDIDDGSVIVGSNDFEGLWVTPNGFQTLFDSAEELLTKPCGLRFVPLECTIDVIFRQRQDDEFVVHACSKSAV